MASIRHIPLVEVTRGRIVESIHYGSFCLSRPDGSIVQSAGDIETPFFLRSSAKPFQALAFLERGGMDHYQLEQREIAIICASHSGTIDHIEVLERLQKKTGVDESLLQCGVHAPYHKASAEKLLMEGKPLHSNHNNCSGKHTGMLSFAKMISAPLGDYLEPSHPIQQAILQTFSEMCSVDPLSVELGTDGCTAPVFAVPLPAAALGYARLCQPDDMTTDRADACRTITASMAAHADMVAGPERFDTLGMVTGKAAFISKLGAEGYRGIGILPGKANSFNNGLGLAIKISDGDISYRATSVVALAVLDALGILDEQQMAALKQFGHRPITNWRGKEIGEIRPSRELVNALAFLN